MYYLFDKQSLQCSLYEGKLMTNHSECQILEQESKRKCFSKNHHRCQDHNIQRRLTSCTVVLLVNEHFVFQSLIQVSFTLCRNLHRLSPEWKNGFLAYFDLSDCFLWEYVYQEFRFGKQRTKFLQRVKLFHLRHKLILIHSCYFHPTHVTQELYVEVIHKIISHILIGYRF